VRDVARLGAVRAYRCVLRGIEPAPRKTAAPGGYDHRAMTVAIDETLIAEAGRRLAEAAPDARVILFGSHARGQARPGSDLDLLVIEPNLRSRRAEFVRLREALGAIGVPVDLIVVSTDHVSKWGNVHGGVILEALQEGRVLAGA
jgi:predicted nucleotidyltransferase